MLGLEAWIIQDGNYRDFRRGEQVELAVECSPLDPLVAADGDATARYLGAGSEYSLRGGVVHRDGRAAVIDCGIFVYTNHKDLPAGTRTVASSKVYLGVDPFDYFDGLYGLPRFPPLIYTWTIERIHIETTPWVEEERSRRRDPAVARTYALVEETDAWHDDEGYADYVLECALLDVSPKATSITA